MPSSTTFVFIVPRFSAVLGALQVFEKKSFITVRAQKKILEPDSKKMVNPTEMAHTSKFFSYKVLSYVLKSHRVVIFNFLQF